MHVRNSKSLLGTFLIIAGLLFQPINANAQCTIASVDSGTLSSGGMNSKWVIKYFNSSESCSLTMSMNVIACNPSPSGSVLSLTATAYTTATNPSCGWNCGCGPVTINNADGLPVELLDFSIGQVPGEGK